MEIQKWECWMRKFFAICLAYVTFVSIGCSPAGPTGKKERIDNIVRVFMNDPSRKYTFLVQNGNVLKEKTIYTSSFGGKEAATYIKDVPADQKMWAEVTQGSDGIDTLYILEIHIHDESDIEGGGWNHGKFGRGTTTVVQ